jgi:excisionase family DNA binding protein
MGDDLITTGEAARLLGVRSVNTVKRLIREGRIQATRPGSHYRVRRADVERLTFNKRSVDAGPLDPMRVPRERIAAWAEEHGVKSLAVFGSAARRQLRPDSDVDLVMELQPDARVGLLRHARMTSELEDIFGRRVDLGTRAALKPRIRPLVEREAILLYEA